MCSQVYACVCVLSVCLRAGRQTRVVQCVRQGASWQGESPPATVPDVSVVGISVSVYECGGGCEEVSGDV